MEDETASVRLLKLGKNQGKGGALMNGVLRSRGKYILMVGGYPLHNGIIYPMIFSISILLIIISIVNTFTICTHIKN